MALSQYLLTPAVPDPQPSRICLGSAQLGLIILTPPRLSAQPFILGVPKLLGRYINIVILNVTRAIGEVWRTHLVPFLLSYVYLHFTGDSHLSSFRDIPTLFSSRWEREMAPCRLLQAGGDI